MARDNPGHGFDGGVARLHFASPHPSYRVCVCSAMNETNRFPGWYRPPSLQHMVRFIKPLERFFKEETEIPFVVA